MVETQEAPAAKTNETAAEKACRYLVSGHVTVQFVDGTRILASVEGDTGVYDVQRTSLARWICTCPAGQFQPLEGGRDCSHVRALQLIAAEPRS